jgi:hypothetical protein
MAAPADLDSLAGFRGRQDLPGSFEPPAGLDPAQRVLSGLAQARTGIR